MAFGIGIRARPARAIVDVRPSDLGLGLVTAALVLGGAATGVGSMNVTSFDEPTSVLAPGEIAVAVRSVPPSEIQGSAETHSEGTHAGSDVPAPSGAPPKPGTPTGGRLAATPVPPRPADAPAPSPTGSLPERPVGGMKGLPRLTPPSAPSLQDLGDDAAPPAPGFGPGGPAVAPGSADPATSPNDPYAYVDPATEDPDARPGQGAVADDDADDAGSGMDPLAVRAVAAYRQRLQRWLSVHFFVEGSGLSKEALKGARIGARLEIAADRTVLGYVIDPGGLPALEAAARRALDQVIGQPLPEPPEHYPGPLQHTIRASFVCTEATCE